MLMSSLVTTDHSYVFPVRAVVFSDLGSLALQQRSFSALTLHIVQQDPDTSVCRPQRSPVHHRQRRAETKLTTHHRARLDGEQVIAHRPPLPQGEDFHSASIG